MKKRRRASGPKPEPRVGVFWLVNGRLVIDASPVSQAEDYADCKTHGRSHQEYWEHLVKLGVVPAGEYEEHPRGRVVYNSKTRKFTIYADRCILGKRAVASQIIRTMHLPSSTTTSTDSHYLCFACLRDRL